MKEQIKNLSFNARFENIEPINPMFSKCKIYVCYHGDNRNNSDIKKKVILNALPTIYNIPIVGMFIEENDNFGGHGGKVEVVEHDNGEVDVKWIDETKPFGVIPESATFSWEDVIEENGDVNEYLVIDGGILWTGRYPELELMKKYKMNQSMEINEIQGFYNSNKKYEITSFVFSALCILGSSKNGTSPETEVIPCFESGSIEMYSLENFRKEFSLMMEQFSLASKQYAEGKSIKINNTKEAANMTGSWSVVNKTKLRNDLMDASNAKSLVDEGYLIVDSNWKDAPSEALHYPHHQVKNGELIVHKRGLEAAFSRLMQNDPTNQKALDHLKRHYRELGLNMENFAIEDGTTIWVDEDKVKIGAAIDRDLYDDGKIVYPRKDTMLEIKLPASDYAVNYDEGGIRLERRDKTTERAIDRTDVMIDDEREKEQRDKRVRDIERREEEYKKGEKKMAKKRDFTKFELSQEQLEEQLRGLVCGEVEDDGRCEYYMVDYYAGERNEVIVCDWDGCLYGFPYKLDGDRVVVDMTIKQPYRVDFVPLRVSGHDEIREEIVEHIVTNEMMEYKMDCAKKEMEAEMKKDKEYKMDEHEMKRKYEEEQRKFEEEKRKYEEDKRGLEDRLKRAEDRVEEERQLKRDALEALDAIREAQRERDFEELYNRFKAELTDEEMKHVKEHAKNCSKDEVEMQLYAMVGKKKGSFSLNSNNSGRVSVWTDSPSNKKQSGPSWATLMDE